MLGFSREELLAMPISASHPDEMPILRAFAQSVFNIGVLTTEADGPTSLVA